MASERPVDLNEQERREFPRIRAFGELHGRPVPLQVTLVLEDLSLGGFSIESPLDFRPGVEYWFELIGRDGAAMLRAICMHCAGTSPFYGADYFAGFRFARTDEKDIEAIGAMVDGLLTARTSG